MNKKGIGIICVIIVVAVGVIAFMAVKNSKKEEIATTITTAGQSQTTQAVTQANKVTDSDVKVVKKYNFYEEDDFKLVLILQNNGQGDAAVAVTAKIRDGANSVIGTERETVFMDPSSKTVVSFDFDTEGTKVKDVDYKLSVAPATSVKPGLKNIMYKKNIIGNIVKLSSKNEGSFDLEGVETNVLFYQNGELVDIESEDMIDNDSEVFVKGTEVKQSFDTKEKFDKVKIYYSQDQDKPDSEDDDD